MQPAHLTFIDGLQKITRERDEIDHSSSSYIPVDVYEAILTAPLQALQFHMCPHMPVQVGGKHHGQLEPDMDTCDTPMGATIQA